MTLFTPVSSRATSPEWRVTTPSSSFSADSEVSYAVRMFEKAAVSYESSDTAAKDVAQLIHTIGRIDEGVQHVQFIMGLTKHRRAYCLLLGQLKNLMGKPIPPMVSRVVFVEVPANYGRISLDTLSNLFPNIQKVWRLILAKDARSCLIEFASHSSARRAVDARLQGHSSYNSSPSVVRCAWVSPSVNLPPLSIAGAADLPIVEFATDDSIIQPSLDWRRPRPRNNSDHLLKKFPGEFSPQELMSVLNLTGAFDDYPPNLSQLQV